VILYSGLALAIDGQDRLVLCAGEQYVVFSGVLVTLHSGLALAINAKKRRPESENKTVLLIINLWSRLLNDVQLKCKPSERGWRCMRPRLEVRTASRTDSSLRYIG
jgi:hypothetical protein